MTHASRPLQFANNPRDAAGWQDNGLGPIVGSAGRSRFLRVQAEYPHPGAIEQQLGIADPIAYEQALIVPLAYDWSRALNEPKSPKRSGRRRAAAH